MTRATIHWVSPLPPAQTDIAHYTRRILPDLAERADVVLWTDAEHWDPELTRFATVRRFDPAAAEPMPLAGLPQARNPLQAVFHNFGNSWVFHSGISALSRRVPGCVVLHDLTVQEFFRDMVLYASFGRSRYISEMVAHYGEEVRETAQSIASTGTLPPETLTRCPMFESTLIGATGALCHTSAGFEAFRKYGTVPSYRLELPFAVSPDWSAQRDPDGPLRLVQFGYIAGNRRLESVLQALGEVKDEVDFVFDLFGTLWNAELIERQVREQGLESHVRFRGFAPEAELDAALRDAHLVFNLRHPTMGEASGSQLRVWNAAACSVVTEQGWFAELPQDTVLRIGVENEIPDLVALIRRFDADREMGRAVGAAGRARFEAAHDTGTYADGIVEIARRSARDSRDAMMLRAAGWALETAPARTEFTPLRRRAIRNALSTQATRSGHVRL